MIRYSKVRDWSIPGRYVYFIRKEAIMEFVRFGRIVLRTDKVVSVVRKNGSKQELHTEVAMESGKLHDFKVHGQSVWVYFKGVSDEGAE